jgi:hypothetical protein
LFTETGKPGFSRGLSPEWRMLATAWGRKTACRTTVLARPAAAPYQSIINNSSSGCANVSQRYEKTWDYITVRVFRLALQTAGIAIGTMAV